MKAEAFRGDAGRHVLAEGTPIQAPVVDPKLYCRVRFNRGMGLTIGSCR
jgi:hypothetical protein